MSHCPQCEREDTVLLLDDLLRSVNDGAIERFRAASSDPNVTIMLDPERKAVLKMLDRLLGLKEDLPTLMEITRKKLEMKSRAREN